MFELLGPIIVDIAKDLKPAELINNLILFAAAWWVIKSSIKSHLSAIEVALSKVADNVEKLGDQLKEVQDADKDHTQRIVRIETNIKLLNRKLNVHLEA